jgi:hypothetical protein
MTLRRIGGRVQDAGQVQASDNGVVDVEQQLAVAAVALGFGVSKEVFVFSGHSIPAWFLSP